MGDANQQGLEANDSPVGGTADATLDYGDSAAEYEAAVSSVGLHDRNYRALIELTGKDRSALLHNLCTNEIKNLQPGEGNYAFLLNIKGRILFDGNALVERDRIWFDLQRSMADAAVAHIGKYIIMEDAAAASRAGEFARFAWLGPKAADLAMRLGVGHAAALAQLQHVAVQLEGAAVMLIRHDFAGATGYEVSVPAASAEPVWNALLGHVEEFGGRPVGWTAIQTLRIEAGIPWSEQEISDEVLPAETRQLERAVSFQKGCYLGQEIVERMRAHRSVAKALVGVRIEGSTVPPVPAELRSGDAVVGTLTSVCQSPGLDAVIGLGYVRTAQSQAGTPLRVRAADQEFAAQIAALPFRHG